MHGTNSWKYTRESKAFKPLCHKHFPQKAFACSKLTIQTLEQGVKFFINKDTRRASLT